ncbi:hypothetical protein AJ80_04815 [Polytolypa hystricis UAMH7299]|uniref:Uncharacterized protein n=1 Tax=Polytolypa hystricis (strain UAMH7299) TaxID=1447883 RepID=A0A2B7Y882_POLH7|nr:hypothetical protein AJ80_04815 [Polytolypa hystricis UAMH7299]
METEQKIKLSVNNIYPSELYMKGLAEAVLQLDASERFSISGTGLRSDAGLKGWESMGAYAPAN